MGFWNQAGGVEPLRQYRWYITFGGTTSLDIVDFALKKCDKPKVKINTIQHKWLNHFFNFPGRAEWEDIQITFASIADPSVSQKLKTILNNSNYVVPTNSTQRGTLSKYKFASHIAGDGISLTQVNAEGDPIETWKIFNPFFTSIQFGSLDYSSEEIVDIQCTIKYDYAKLTVPKTDS